MKKPVDIGIAREAITKLRDHAREGIVLHYRLRDPLVIVLHDALDELERHRIALNTIGDNCLDLAEAKYLAEVSLKGPDA